jgi:hypothetical protein
MERISGILLLIAATVIYVIIVALPVMLLWNWIIVAIFGAVKITFWQAFGLSLLIRLFFNNSKQ